MTKSKLILVSVVAVLTFGVVAAAGIVGVTVVRAAVGNGNFPPLIQNLITRFNLNPADVATVIQDTRTQQVSDRLDQAVANKLITADQKTLILNKLTEVQKQVADINNKQLTQAERQTQLQQLRTDLHTWATGNNIPPRLLMPGFGGKGGRGGMMGGGMMGGELDNGGPGMSW